MSSTIPFPRQGIPLRADRGAVTRDWAVSFTRATTAVVLSHVSKVFKADAGTILRAQWPNDERAELILRGAVEPLKQTGVPGNTITQLIALAPQSAAARLFELAIKVDLAGVSAFSFPLAASFSDAQFVEEGAPIPAGQGVFVGMPLGPIKKVALIAALTRELENLSGHTAAVVIEHVLKTAVGQGLDKVLFSADAATDIAPAGLLFDVTPIAGSDNMSKDLSALAASIAAAGVDAESVVFIASAGQAAAIRLAAGSHFAYRVIGANIPAGTVVAIASVGLVVAGEGTPQVDVGKHSVIHFADPASPISTPPNVVAGPTGSMFQVDGIALRCVARITWAVAPGSVAAITGATW